MRSTSDAYVQNTFFFTERRVFTPASPRMGVVSGEFFVQHIIDYLCPIKDFLCCSRSAPEQNSTQKICLLRFSVEDHFPFREDEDEHAVTGTFFSRIRRRVFRSSDANDYTADGV